MKLPKLINGEIYYCNVFSNPYLFKMQKNKSDIKHLQCNKEYFSNWGWDFWTDSTLTEIQIASVEQKHWLNECIKINEYISYDDAMLSFTLNIKDDPELGNILIKLLTQ